MKIANKPLSEFSIRHNGDSQSITYAAGQLQMYISRALGIFLDITTQSRPNQIVLGIGYDGKPNGFCYHCKDGDLYLTGQNERGAIYAVYDFLERFIGWRFFASAMCIKGVETGQYIDSVERIMTPLQTEIAEGECIEENPVILFRDCFGHATVDEDWCVKNKINGDIWKLKNTPDYMGGTESFASQGGHSFDELLPERYLQTNPEYFSLVNGERKAGWNSQICLTNMEAAEEVAKNAKEILRKNPYARYISVSQNDNSNFCQCERCKKAEKEIGLGNVLFRFVNFVAERIEEEFPKVMIHTYAYESTIQNANERLRKNVLLQYCLRYCHAHKLTDNSCVANVAVANRLKDLSKKCSELFIYDYRSSEAHIFQFMPDIFRFRENMKFLAECKVKGLYSEADIFCQNSPCMEELRAYVTAKLMWNPYMSEMEFNRHINEFLEGYYGAGWKYIRKYMEIWDEETQKSHFDSVLGNVADDSGSDIIGDDGLPVRCQFMPKEKVESVCARLEEELNKAIVLAGEAEKPRIEMLYVATLWYRLFNTMHEIMESGSKKDKEKIVEDNYRLSSLMRRYCMKYTCFIGMTEITEMYKDFTLSPNKWQYWEKNSKRRVFDNIMGKQK